MSKNNRKNSTKKERFSNSELPNISKCRQKCKCSFSNLSIKCYNYIDNDDEN